MDILLTHGYFLEEDPHEREVMRPYPPLGLLYLASYLKAGGFQVEVFDTTFRSRRQLERHLAGTRPPVVGIYGNLMTRASVLEIARVSKRAGALVIAGGPEPAQYAEEYLARNVDCVVAGEGELTLEELLARFRSGNPPADISGIIYRDEQGRIVRNAARSHIRDLDSLPFPDRSAIDMAPYLEAWRRHHGRSSVSLITSRGCPYTCKWCSHDVFGFSHRARSPDNVAREVEQIRLEFQPDMLWYCDDVFTINPRWFRAYARELERRNLKMPFETISREDRLDEEIIQVLAGMGCVRLWIGSESGSQRILDAMDRRTDAERVAHMVRLLQKYGIEAGLFVMLGYEGETEEDLERTVEHLKKADPDVFLSTVAYPIKGTPYYEEVASRVVSPAPWESSSDRDLMIRGRHSRRYYSFASRWISGEVHYHQSRRDSPIRALRALASAKFGRAGMLLTRHQKC